jgi:hypothetical protein
MVVMVEEDVWLMMSDETVQRIDSTVSNKSWRSVKIHSKVLWVGHFPKDGKLTT